MYVPRINTEVAFAQLGARRAALFLCQRRAEISVTVIVLLTFFPAFFFMFLNLKQPAYRKCATPG
jgi:hypothetical protein